MNIIHLSDLHFANNNPQLFNYLKRPLYDDLRQVHDLTGPPDALILSGDLVNDPDEPDVYLRLYDIIEEMLVITKLSWQSVLICPGNHDVSRKYLERNRESHEGIAIYVGDANYLSDAYTKGRLQSYLRGLNEPFFEFAAYCGIEWPDPFQTVRRVAGAAFISLNSTLYCSLAGSKKDRGQLVVPGMAFEAAAAQLQPNEPAYVLVHHPLGELAEPYARYLRPRMQKLAKAVLFGHLHDPVPSYSLSPAGGTLLLQAGALFERDDRFKGYSLLTIDPSLLDARRVLFRTYIDNRGEFDVGTNAAKGGVFYPSEKEQHAYQNRKPAFTPDLLRQFLGQLDIRGSELNNTVGSEKLYDVYVEQPLTHYDVTEQKEDLETSEKRFSFAKLRGADDHLVVFFPDQTGATSFLAYIALDICSSPDRFAKPRIPLYVDLRPIPQAYEAAVTRVLKQAHPEVDHALFGWKARTEDQPYVVLVDNYDAQNAAHAEWLGSAASLLTKARFIVTVKTPFAVITRVRPDTAMPFEYRALVARPFRRQDVRAAVEKYRLPNVISENVVIDEIVSRFNNLSVPLSGPLIAMYLTILKEKGKYAPLNASAVIENFVEALLEKSEAGAVFREDVDYGERIALLEAVAEKYWSNAADGLPFEDLYMVIDGYYKAIGITNRNPQKMIGEFCDQKILENVGNKIFVKYRFVLAYLVARRMAAVEAFRREILSDKYHGRHVLEIDIYCGLRRADVESLRAIAACYAASKAAAMQDIGAFGNIDAADDVKVPRIADLEAFVGQVTKSMLAPQSKNGADAELDMTAGEARFRRRIREPEVRNKIVRWIMSLQAYSVAVKNLEGIPKEDKELHLGSVLEGWAVAAMLAVRVTAVALEKDVVEFAGIRVRFNLGKAIDGKLMRLLLMNIPRLVSHYARLYVGTAKLQDQLRIEDERPIPNFIATSILADLRSAEWLSVVKRYLRRFRRSGFMLEIMMWKLRDSFLRFGATGSELDEFRRLVVETDADILGLRGPDRERRISQNLQTVERRRLVNKQAE